MTSTTPTDSLVPELQRIQALIADNKLQEAATGLNALQQLHRNDARLFGLGMRLGLQAGNTQGALQSGRRMLELAPDWPVGLIDMGRVLSSLGQHDEAMTLARKAVRLAPNNRGIFQWAIRIAIAAGQGDQAISWLRDAVKLAPTDHALRSTLVYRLLERPTTYPEAKTLIAQLLEERPEDVDVLYARALLARREGRDDDVRADAQILIRLAPDNEMIQHLHAVAHGQTPPTQSSKSVSALFDSYAASFDKSLWNELQYRVPRQVAEQLAALHPDRKFSVLDLGCGTGLLGLFLGPPAEGFIIGVDLSLKMIEQAAKHNVYARFHNVNILDALTATPSDHYEAITCCDALVYVGDLTPVIPGAYRILKPGGHFIFSCETAGEDEADLVLRKSDRYAHKVSHVERLCREAGFDSVEIEHLPKLRMESGSPLPGFLVTAHKPAA